jgi:hypothetical protein
MSPKTFDIADLPNNLTDLLADSLVCTICLCLVVNVSYLLKIDVMLSVGVTHCFVAICQTTIDCLDNKVHNAVVLTW